MSPLSPKCTTIQLGSHCPAPSLCAFQSLESFSTCVHSAPTLCISCFAVLHLLCFSTKLASWEARPLPHSLYKCINTAAGDQLTLAKCDLSYVQYLWLFADGLHKNIITRRMSEKRKLQNASSTQRSIQSYSKDKPNMES